MAKLLVSSFFEKLNNKSMLARHTLEPILNLGDIFGTFITLFISITMLCGTDINLHNIPHI